MVGLVFATWYGDRLNSLPQRIGSSLTSSVVDLLRLGNDIDFGSAWGVAKGALLNFSRLATIAGPAAEAVGVGGRYAGVLATSKLADIPGANGPCVFVAVNNVLSYMRGRTVQLFAAVGDIVTVTGANSGTTREALLATNEVRAALARFGITWQPLAGMNSINDVLRAARSAEGPITFGIEWELNGATERHALTAVKDAAGSVRILDYVDSSIDAFKGFGSMAEMVAARPQWGRGFASAVLRTDVGVEAFSSRYLKLLKFADGSYRLGLPIAMGLKWMRGGGQDGKLFDIGRSVWRFLKSKLGDEAPIAQTPSVLPQPQSTDQPIPSLSDAGGKRLGVSPLPREAAGAPRIHWLTGVQYRLKYLGYYKGAVHGQNDHATKGAVLRFQKDWFADGKQWDAIPGPITQGMLYSVVGW